jgi:hypothetical protein
MSPPDRDPGRFTGWLATLAIPHALVLGFLLVAIFAPRDPGTPISIGSSGWPSFDATYRYRAGTYEEVFAVRYRKTHWEREFISRSHDQELGLWMFDGTIVKFIGASGPIDEFSLEEVFDGRPPAGPFPYPWALPASYDDLISSGWQRIPGGQLELVTRSTYDCPTGEGPYECSGLTGIVPTSERRVRNLYGIPVLYVETFGDNVVREAELLDFRVVN